MGVFNFGSLALVSLAVVSSLEGVAARPHRHDGWHNYDARQDNRHHHGHGGGGGNAGETLTTTIIPVPNESPYTTYSTFTTTRTFTITNGASPNAAPPPPPPPPSFPPPPSPPPPGPVPAVAPVPAPAAPVPAPLNPPSPAFQPPSQPPFQPPTTSTSSAPPSSTSSNSEYPALDYSLVKCYSDGGSFFDNFNFFTGTDPTNGFVTYVDQGTASSANLAYEQNGVAYIASDSTNVAPNGRQSVRIESKDSYNEVLIIADFTHLPAAACGTWPAFWTTNLNNWPSGGEIDIIEGVNLNTVNHVALHTSPGSSVSGGDQMSTFATTDCDATVDGNAGCGGYTAASTSYGDTWNNAGGGVYAMDWRAQGIRVWSFTRDNIPQDILSGAPTIANWPVPDFDFTGPNANIPSHFNSHQIIFDLTFCGDWAGNVFSTCVGCSGTCSDFVANNPSAFADSYFGVANLTVWQASGASSS